MATTYVTDSIQTSASARRTGWRISDAWRSGAAHGGRRGHRHHGLHQSYRQDRRRAREIALEGGSDFFEIFVDAPLEVCEQRDPKGLYKKARAGEIKEFTGISAPYEAPTDPELTLHTDRETLQESVARIIEFLKPLVRGDDFVEI
jgi:hypothetical protein